MKVKKTVLFLMVIFFLLDSAGCTKQQANPVDVFKDGNVFNDSEFGITMKVPDGWVQTEEEKNRAQEIAEKIGGENTKNATNLLVMASKYPIKSGRADNAFVSWDVQDVRKYPGIDSASYALKDKTATEKKPKLGIAAVKGPYIEKIDNVEFSVIDYKSTQRTAFQKTYISVRNGYAYCLTLTYTTPEDFAICNEAVKSVKLQK